MPLLDPNNLTEELSKELEEYLYKVLDKSFERKGYDYNKFKLNCALKKKTIRQAYADGDLAGTGISKEYIKTIEDVNLDENYKPDEFSALKHPLLLKLFRAIQTHVGNICFPLNGDQVGFSRNYSEFFDNNNINEFLPQADAAWQSIIECQNRNNQSKAVYESILSEGLAHSVWAIDHEYDDQSEIVEPVAPGIDNVGLYPLRADWRKTNRCFYIDVNYNQLLERADLDQEVIKKIKPNVNYDDRANTDRTAHNTPHSTPFGQVRLIKFYCPSVYLEHNDEVYYSEGLYVVALINPEFKPSEKGQSDIRKLYFLKIRSDVPMDRHGLLLGSPVVNMPKQFFNEGIFYPWLDHQATVNEFYANGTRLSSYLAKGPFNAEKTGYGGINSEEEDLTKGFSAFQVLKDRKYTPVFSAEHIQFIDVSYRTIAKLESDVREGIGVSEELTAAVNKGKNLKDEVLRAGDSGYLKILEYAVRFNEQIYVPSLFTITRSTQEILKEQVDIKLQEIKELVGSEGQEIAQFLPPDEMIVEQILEENKLFKRLLNQSGLKQKYREFYKKRQKQILENQQIMLELQLMEKEIMQTYMFSQSPVNMKQMPPFETREVEDPETGKVIMEEMTAEDKNQAKQEWIQSEKERRANAAVEVDRKMLEVSKKQLSLTPLEEIPPLSNMLLFNILVSPIEESDIQIGGILSALLKTLTGEEVREIVRLIQVMPESETKKIDFGDLFTLATKGKRITKDLIMKSEEELTRQEEADKQQAEFDRQVSIEMARNPGSQPPQVGEGNRSG